MKCSLSVRSISRCGSLESCHTLSLFPSAGPDVPAVVFWRVGIMHQGECQTNVWEILPTYYFLFFFFPFHSRIARRYQPKTPCENVNYWYLLHSMSYGFIFWSCDIHTTSNLFVFFFLLSTELLDRPAWGIRPSPVKCLSKSLSSFHPSPFMCVPETWLSFCKLINFHLYIQSV